MENILSEIQQGVKDAASTMIILLKIMIPISIIVKLLKEFGVINIVGDVLGPVMNLVGLPGDIGIVWATAMITNIYGGLVVFFSLNTEHSFTIAQVTVLGAMILVAHTLPVELRIAQKAGVRLWFMLLLRVLCAFTLGLILHYIFTIFGMYQKTSTSLWKPGYSGTSLIAWVVRECTSYIMIFVIILFLFLFMKLLKKTGAIDWLNNRLEPLMKMLGLSKKAAPVTIIGMTLGVTYGGGLIIAEAKSGILSKKDVFLSLSFMGLSHSLIEDTLLMVAIGASLSGILIGRLAFTIAIMIILIKAINHISEQVFTTYFMHV